MAFERFVEALSSSVLAFFFAAMRDFAVVAAPVRMPSRSTAAAWSTNFSACSASLASRPEGTCVAFVLTLLVVVFLTAAFFFGAGFAAFAGVDFFAAGFFFAVAIFGTLYAGGIGKPPDSLGSVSLRRLPSGRTAAIISRSMDALIDLLKHNPLIAREDAARLLGLTVNEVNARIAALERDGVIIGYQTVINREKWNPDTVTAVIEVKITPERDGGFDRIASRISKFDEVQSCYLMSGGYDLLVLVEAGNLRQVASFVAEKLSTIEAVVSTATRFRLKTYKENGAFHHFDVAPERLSVSP